MRRRSFIMTVATAIALPLSGCSEPTGGSLLMDALNNDSAIGKRYAGLTDNLSSDRRDLVEDAIAGETPSGNGDLPPTRHPGHSNTRVRSITSLTKLWRNES